MSGAPSIAVIGAGIYGLSSALWLQRGGCRVTVFDPLPPGDPRQASYGNGGVLAPAGVMPSSSPGVLGSSIRMALDPNEPLFLRWPYLPWAARWLWRFVRAGDRESVARIADALSSLIGDAVEQHRALAEPAGAGPFLREGNYLYLFNSRADFEAEAFGFGHRKRLGHVWEERDRAALLDDDPELGPAYQFGLKLGGHGWIENPGAYLRALGDAFRSEGGGLTPRRVEDIEPDAEGVAVIAGGESARFDHAVLAAGAWSTPLARRLGLNPHLEPERGYHLMLREPSWRPPHAMLLSDAKTVVTPMTVDGAPALRIAGQVEIAGFDAPPRDRAVELLRRAITRLYPGLTWKSEESWLGFRPSPADSTPYIGAVPNAPRVVCCFGGQHIGLTSGPKAGRLAADLVLGRRPNIDLTPFRLVR